jgi:D-tyrosyl-tRNA(Tyr) deacylase
MNFLLIISEKDIASNNFKDELFNNYKIKELYKNNYNNENNKNYKNIFYLDNNYYKFRNNIYIKIISELHIYCENLSQSIPKEINIDSIIFLSKHSTKNIIKNKCITVHAIGNYSKAELGGKDFTLVENDPILIRSILLELKSNKKRYTNIKEYEIKQEATHHGPYIDKPALFYEIGSCREDWKNKNVSKFMIKILLNIIKNYNSKEIKKKNNWLEVVGVGGSHYCTKFNRYSFNKNNKYCFGHIVPNYALKDFKKNKKILIPQVLNKSNSKIILTESLKEYKI